MGLVCDIACKLLFRISFFMGENNVTLVYETSEKGIFAVTLIRKPKPAVTGQNSIFWGFSGYTDDISQGRFFIAEWYLWTKKHRERR